MFGAKQDLRYEPSPLAFPVPPPPVSSTVRPRRPSITFPINTRSFEPSMPAPWTVPEWLPPVLEAPATFVIGACAGIAFALCALLLGRLVLPDAESSANIPAAHAMQAPAASLGGPRVVAKNARLLLITRPAVAAQRAPVVVEEPEVATPAASPAPAATTTLARSRFVSSRPATALRRPQSQPKRDLLDAGLGP